MARRIPPPATVRGPSQPLAPSHLVGGLSLIISPDHSLCLIQHCNGYQGAAASWAISGCDARQHSYDEQVIEHAHHHRGRYSPPLRQRRRYAAVRLRPQEQQPGGTHPRRDRSDIDEHVRRGTPECQAQRASSGKHHQDRSECADPPKWCEAAARGRPNATIAHPFVKTLMSQALRLSASPASPHNTVEKNATCTQPQHAPNPKQWSTSHSAEYGLLFGTDAASKRSIRSAITRFRIACILCRFPCSTKHDRTPSPCNSRHAISLFRPKSTAEADGSNACVRLSYALRALEAREQKSKTQERASW